MSNDTFSERLAYPKGLKGIIANESALSDVRGEEGRLLYLGYDIDDLVEMCCFEEVVYLPPVWSHPPAPIPTLPWRQRCVPSRARATAAPT